MWQAQHRLRFPPSGLDRTNAENTCYICYSWTFVWYKKECPRCQSIQGEADLVSRPWRERERERDDTLWVEDHGTGFQACCTASRHWAKFAKFAKFTSAVEFHICTSACCTCSDRSSIFRQHQQCSSTIATIPSQPDHPNFRAFLVRSSDFWNLLRPFDTVENSLNDLNVPKWDSVT